MNKINLAQIGVVALGIVVVGIICWLAEVVHGWLFLLIFPIMYGMLWAVCEIDLYRYRIKKPTSFKLYPPKRVNVKGLIEKVLQRCNVDRYRLKKAQRERDSLWWLVIELGKVIQYQHETYTQQITDLKAIIAHPAVSITVQQPLHILDFEQDDDLN